MRNQSRVVIESIYPQIDGGNHFIKAVVDQIIPVQADVLVDGHDVIAASVLFKHENDKNWQEHRMSSMENDRWSGNFTVSKQGHYSYKIQGWVDYALNWQHGTQRKIDDGQKVTSELLEGAEYLSSISKKANKTEAAYLKELQSAFKDPARYDEAIAGATSEKLHQIL